MYDETQTIDESEYSADGLSVLRLRDQFKITVHAAVFVFILCGYSEDNAYAFLSTLSKNERMEIDNV